MQINLNADVETIGKGLIAYGMAIATRKGYRGANRDDAAAAFTAGAFEAFLALDPEKMGNGTGAGFVYRGGMNGLVAYQRHMNRFDGRKDSTCESEGNQKARLVRGEYGPADVDTEALTLWEMLADPKAVLPEVDAHNQDIGRKVTEAVQADRDGALIQALADGKTFREIGAALGISGPAIHKRVAKARERLSRLAV